MTIMTKLEEIKTFFESGKPDNEYYFSLVPEYKELGRIVEHDLFPVYSTKVLDTIEIGLQSDLNDGDSLSAAYGVLSRAVEKQPQLAEKVLSVLKKGLQSDKNDHKSLYSAYFTLTTIVSKKPQLSTEVFEIFESCLKSDKNNNYSFVGATSALDYVLDSQPQLVTEVKNVCNSIQNKDDLRKNCGYVRMLNILKSDTTYK